MSTNATPARYVSIGDVITIGTTYVGTGDENTASTLNALAAKLAESERERNENACALAKAVKRLDAAHIEHQRMCDELLDARTQLAAAEHKIKEHEISLSAWEIAAKAQEDRAEAAEALKAESDRQRDEWMARAKDAQSREAKLREALESIAAIEVPDEMPEPFLGIFREIDAILAATVTGIPVTPSGITDTQRLDWLENNPKASAFGGDGCCRQVAIASERDEPYSDMAKPWYGRGPWSGRTIRAAIDAAMRQEGAEESDVAHPRREAEGGAK